MQTRDAECPVFSQSDVFCHSTNLCGTRLVIGWLISWLVSVSVYHLMGLLAGQLSSVVLLARLSIGWWAGSIDQLITTTQFSLHKQQESITLGPVQLFLGYWKSEVNCQVSVFLSGFSDVSGKFL